MLEPLRPLHPYLFRYKKRYLIGFAALLVTQILGVSLPLVVRSGVDSLIETLNRDRLFFFYWFVARCGASKGGLPVLDALDSDWDFA